MNIKEIVEFPSQLIKVETKKINAEKIHEEVKKELMITANTKGEIIDKFNGKSIITIKVENEDFHIEQEKIGYFKFSQEIQDEKDAERFLEVQGVRILWSYVREDLYMISSRMLPSPLMIPTIDVMKTIEKADENDN